MLTFYEPNHTYRWNNAIVPGVTEILEDCGISDFSMVPRDALEAAQERGRLVHEITHMYDEDDLDMQSVDPSLQPYLDGWAKFRGDTGFTPELIEERVYNESYRYAGTLDRVGTMGTGRRTVVDIKTGIYLPAVRLQLTGYSYCLDELADCIAVYLTDQGKYRVSGPYDPTEYFADFAAALRIWNYKRRD